VLKQIAAAALLAAALIDSPATAYADSSDPIIS
jgi:hypothetical protein